MARHIGLCSSRSHSSACLYFLFYSPLTGFTSCIVNSFRSRRSSMPSPPWTPSVYGPTSQVQLKHLSLDYMSFCRAILDRYHEKKWTDLQSPFCGQIEGWTIRPDIYVYAVPGPTVRYATESCTDRCSSQFKNNYLAKKCSGSEVGSYIRSIDCVYP